MGVVASEQPERGTETFRDRKPLDPFDEIKARGIDRNPIALQVPASPGIDYRSSAFFWLSKNEEKPMNGWQLKDVQILGSEKGMLAGMLLLLFHPSPSFLVLSRRLVGARH